nr:phage terminase large subunit [uncultured Anaeromusa sp.]
MLEWSKESVEKAWNDFRYFVYIVWKSISLPQPTEIQFAMAHDLQHPPSDRMILEGFRGVAKSFLTCALCVWLLWKDPTLKVQMVSASGGKASLNSSFIKKLILIIPFLEPLRLTDEDRRAGLRDTNDLFDVHGAVPDISPSVKSVGITGQLTGSRADVLIADDVEVPSNSGTQIQRDKLNELVKEFDAILKPGGRIIYLGTPQCEESLYTRLAERGYTTIVYPVLYPQDAVEREFYGEKLGKLLATRYDADPKRWAGEPTDPARFSIAEITKRKLSYGKAGFMLQFMLNTNLSDAEKYPLRVSDFIVTDLEMDKSSVLWSWASGPGQCLKEIPCVALKGDYFYGPLSRSEDVQPYSGGMMFIDPSGRGKDETAYSVTKFLNGYIFCMEVGGYREGYTDTTLLALVMKAKFWGVNVVRIEPNFGDGMFTKLIQPVFMKNYPCKVEEGQRAVGQKEKRIIDLLEPLLARHRIIMNTSVIHQDYKVFQDNPQYSLIYQLTRLCAERGALGHDDRLEAFAESCYYWIEQIAVDQDQEAEARLEEALEVWMDPDRGVLYVEELNPKPKKTSARNSGVIGNVLDSFFGSLIRR